MKELSSEAWGDKYRPTKLKHFLGNSSAVNTVEGFLKRREIPRAILISGPTGSGKTTLARIIAMMVNGATSFKASFAREENAAMKGGIDAIRSLVESSRYLPRLAFNVYILDEAHKLTKDGAGALLKTLEDKSRNVWILCTNEPDQLLATLRGRCAKIHLEYPDKKTGVKILLRTCKREGIFQPAEKYKKALLAVYRASGSDPRTMLNGLQSVANVVSVGRKTLTERDIITLVRGAALSGDKSVNDVLSLILKGDAKGMARLVNGWTWKFDVKFAGDLLKAMTRHMERVITEDRKGLGTLVKVIDKLGRAAEATINSPVMISGPLFYSAVLQCAVMVQNGRKDNDD